MCGAAARPISRLLRPGKFAEQFSRGRHVGVVGFLCGCENSKIVSPTSFGNDGSPSSGRDQRHAFETGSVIPVTAPVSTVLRLGCAAQVDPAIVRWIPVAVVDNYRAPLPHHVEPGQLMGQIVLALDRDVPISALPHCPGNVINMGRSTHSLQPTKLSSLRIVTQKLEQPCVGNSPTFSHGALAK